MNIHEGKGTYWKSLNKKTQNQAEDRVRSGIFRQTAKFGQRNFCFIFQIFE